MACTSVIRLARKRSYVSLTSDDQVPPLKRSRSSLRDFSVAEVSALVAQLENASAVRQPKAMKRKREESTEHLPCKRQRLTSDKEWTNVEDNEVGTVPMATHVSDVIVDGGTDEAMSVDEIKAENAENTTATGDEPNMTLANHSGDVVVVKATANDSPVDDVVGNAVGGEQLTAEQLTEVDARRLEEELELICEIHPTVDPVYIREQLGVNINDPHRISTVTFAIYEAVTADLPTREDREAMVVHQQKREQLDAMVLNIDEFVKRYPKPLIRFDVRDTEVTELYHDHVGVFLKNEYREMQLSYIKKVLRQNGFHLTPAYHALKKDREVHINRKGNCRASKIKYRMSPRSATYDYPQEPDEEFYWERLFLAHERQILDHIEAVKQAKRVRYEEAKLSGNLHNCTICLATDVFTEDMGACSSSKHLFCHECIWSSTKELLNQGRASFPCLDLSCDCEFSLSTLELALSKEMMSLVVKRVQIEQLRQAAIENLVSCPFCPYAVIIPEAHTSSVFHCENPECMADSCRKCCNVAHIPYTCDQFKESFEMQYTHYVENKMAEAMIRECPNCHQRFIKEEGCNMMTCRNCNTYMCYICKIEITSAYRHFRNRRCQAITNMDELHKNEVVKALHDSDEIFREQHPEFRSMDTKLGMDNLQRILAT